MEPVYPVFRLASLVKKTKKSVAVASMAISWQWSTDNHQDSVNHAVRQLIASLVATQLLSAHHVFKVSHFLQQYANPIFTFPSQ